MNISNLPKCEELSACPVCQSKSVKFWSQARDLLTQSSDQVFAYTECLDCKCLYMSARPIEADVSFFYSGEYHPYQSHLTPVSDRNSFSNTLKKSIRPFVSRLRRIFSRIVVKSHLEKRVESFYSQLSEQKVFVDFGCGAGKYLNKMRNSGCKTIGVDFSPIAISAITENQHEGYLVSDFWQKINNESIDLVRMNHVVEHLYTPKDTLKKIALKIKKGGGLHIAVPNPAGISSKLFRRNWHGLDCPRHVILYPPDSLVRLLQEIGFNQFEVVHESISKDFIRSLGYFFASFGLIELSKVNNLMYSKGLNFIFWIPLKITSAIGVGDRYHIFCVKK